MIANVVRYNAGTNEEYHAGEGVSNSMLSTYDKSPPEYCGKYVTKDLSPGEQTPDMRLGQLVHELVLLGEFENAVVIPPEVLNKDGHKKGKPWIDWAAEHKGKDQVSQDEMETIRGIRDALAAHPSAKHLLFGDGESEVPLRGTCQETGLLLRCKCDRFSSRFIADLKVMRDVSPQKFAYDADDYGYHRQQAFYSRLASAYWDEPNALPFFFVTVNKTRPYRVETYQLSDEFAHAGEVEHYELLGRLAESYRNDDWQFPHYGNVLTLPMPRRAKSNSQWEV